jgi:hypothetical protein
MFPFRPDSDSEHCLKDRINVRYADTSMNRIGIIQRQSSDNPTSEGAAAQMVDLKWIFAAAEGVIQHGSPRGEQGFTRELVPVPVLLP